MRKDIYQWLLAGGIIFLVISSCEKGYDEPSAPNSPPIADITRTYVVVLPSDSVILKGSAVDNDGYIVSFRWSKIYGPASYRFADSTLPITKVDKLEKGYYKFQFKATDDKGSAVTKVAVVDVMEWISCPCEPNCDDMGDPCNPWDY